MNVSSMLCRSVDELSLFSGCFLKRDGGLLESEQAVSEHVSVRGLSFSVVCLLVFQKNRPG